MRKRDNLAQSQNLTSTKQFIITSAFKHYERSRIDSAVLANFNSLIHSITLRLLKNNNQPQIIQLFRITNDLIIGFLGNLAQQTYRHTCTHEDILQVLSTITNYFQKVVNAFGNNEVVLQSNVIDIFWPFFEKQHEGFKKTDQAKVDLISNLIQNIEQPKKDTSIHVKVIRQSFFVANSHIKKDKSQIKQLFVAVLRQSYGHNNFKQTLMKYITVALSEDIEEIFKKAIKIYEHLGATCEDRRANIQDLLLKTLQYNNCLPFVLAINEVTKISKIVRSTHLPKVMQRILEKIFAKPNIGINCIKILQDLSLANVSQFKDFYPQKLLGGENLVLRFLEWLSIRYIKKESEVDIGSQMLQLQQKMFQEGGFKEQKMKQIVRKMSQKANHETNDIQRLGQIQTVCAHFGNFIKNLFRHKIFRQKITFKNIDQINFAKSHEKLTNSQITDFILDIFPHLIQDLSFNPKSRSALKYSIIIRKAEMQAEKAVDSLTTLKDYFKQVFYQMLQSQSLNYHFVLCFIFLKYEKERDSIRQIIVQAILNDLKKQEVNKNVRNLLLSLSLFLKSYDSEFTSQPIKFKIRDVVKNSDLLTSKIDVHSLITVQPKQYTNLKHQNIRFDSKIQEMKQVLNNEMYNYEARQHLNIFYSLVIATNDLIGTKSKSENLLLTQISSLRKLALLSEFHSIMHLLKLNIDVMTSSYDYSHPSKIEVFLLLLKFKKIVEKLPAKLSEDTDQLFQKLRCYMILINSEMNHDLLTHLDTFRTNQKTYSSQSFQKLIQEQQIIKFYAQAAKDVNFTHVVLNVVAKNLLRKLMQNKKIEFNDLPAELQNIFLFYSKPQQLKLYGFTPQQELLLSNYLQVLLLGLKIQQKYPLQNILKKLVNKSPIILQIFLPKHQKNSFKHLKMTYPVNFIQICVQSVKKALTNSQKEDLSLFQFIKTIIQEDNKNDSCLQNIIRESLENQLADSVCEHIFYRIKKGYELESKNNYFKNSQMLYKLVGKALQKNKDNLLRLVQNIVQLDCYNQSEKSAYILKEISYIFTYLQEKSSQICQTIFEYIITLTDIFKGDQKLEISTFICNFFGLQLNLNQPINFENFQKQTTLTCSNIPNYKCLKCDDKKIVCFGCAHTCHQNHPVCFLNIPVQLKFTRCLCCEIGSNTCKHAKENPNKPNIFSTKPPSFISMNNRLKPIGSSDNNPPQDFFQRMKVLGGNFMPRIPRDHLYQPPLPSDRLQFQAFLRQEELLQQQIRASHVYDSLRDRQRDRQRQRQRERNRQRQRDRDRQRGDRQRDRERERQRREDREEIFPRMGGRLERLFDRDQFPGGYRMFIESNEMKKPSKFIPQQRQKQKNENPIEIIQQEFVDENYSSQVYKNKEQMVIENEDGNTILKKSVLLPKFIDLMVNFCDKKSDKDKNMASVQMFKLGFTNPQISKILPTNVFKLHNAGNFTFQVRKQNQIQNMSCFLVKKNITQNNNFLLLSSSTQIFVYSKQKILNCLSQMKPLPGYNSVGRHSISFQIHSLDFSPLDKNLFCASGLHNLTLLNINNQGQISRTNNRYNVSNCYINQIKLGKMGIFIGVDKEIRVLNYSCRHFLTLKTAQSSTLIRQWTIFQKAAGCQVLFVCPNGNIFTVDIMPTDEGKKQFVSRINFHRPGKAEVGASLFGKQLPQIGKYLFASFKEGCHNILGHLEGDQLQDLTVIQLKGLKFDRNIFDTNFIVGHSDLIKIPQQDELYLICTVKRYFPPQLSFHQGYLIAIKFKKDGTSEIILINDQVNCDYFQVLKLGKRNFFIYSAHSDGSIQITTLNKLNKQIIDEQLLSIKQSENANNQNQNSEGAKNAEDILSLRKSIDRQIKLQNIVQKEDKALFTPFRQGSETLKLSNDYTLSKHNDSEYEFRLVNFSKVLTGFSLPFFGDVELPTRKIKNVFQVGLTQLEVLYFYAQGSLRFKYKKNQQEKFTRQAFFNANNHPRMLDRIQRIQRLSQYHQGDKMFNSQLMNSILGFKEDTNNQLLFIGKNFEVYKAKIPKFQEMFKVESDDQSNSIQKTALIIKMFLTKGIQTGNICTQEEVLQLVKGVKNIIAFSSNRLFNVLKDIIFLGMKVYQSLTGKTLTINDQNYALRAATQNRVGHYFKMLKLDIGDAQLNEFLSLLCDIIKQDKALMTYYVAKYSGIFVLLHRRLKKPDTQQRAIYLIYLYTFAYPILKFCQIPCSWILSSICTIVYSFITSKAVRQALYQAIQNTKFIVFENWFKNISSSEQMVVEIDVANNIPEPKKQEVKDPMVQIYNMYNRGQIDDQTLFKMITDASKLEYQRQQQNQLAVEDNNQQIQPQLQQQMQIQENTVNHNIGFVLDEIDECTDNITENVEVAYSKIIVLYVISKSIDSFFEQATKHLLKRIKKLVNQVDIKCEGEKLNAVLAFSCLFNKILVNSKYLRQNGGKSNPLYLELQAQVSNKLANIRLENIPKIKQPPNSLAKIFRGEKPNFNIHIAYALTCLLLFPCQPSHVLLSLQCYWLLPQKREFYSKKKDFSNITDGIQSGNIQKIYQIAKGNPKIWQQYNELSFVEHWIEEKKPNWQLALELLAIYYEE